MNKRSSCNNALALLLFTSSLSLSATGLSLPEARKQPAPRLQAARQPALAPHGSRAAGVYEGERERENRRSNEDRAPTDYGDVLFRARIVTFFWENGEIEKRLFCSLLFVD